MRFRTFEESLALFADGADPGVDDDLDVVDLAEPRALTIQFVDELLQTRRALGQRRDAHREHRREVVKMTHAARFVDGLVRLKKRVVARVERIVVGLAPHVMTVLDDHLFDTCETAHLSPQLGLFGIAPKALVFFVVHDAEQIVEATTEDRKRHKIFANAVEEVHRAVEVRPRALHLFHDAPRVTVGDGAHVVGREEENIPIVDFAAVARFDLGLVRAHGHDAAERGEAL